MDQWWMPLAIGVLATLPVYLFVSRRHLLAYLERYRALPARVAVLHRDPDPLVETWRRRRLLVTGVLVGLVGLQVLTALT